MSLIVEKIMKNGAFKIRRVCRGPIIGFGCFFCAGPIQGHCLNLNFTCANFKSEPFCTIQLASK